MDSPELQLLEFLKAKKALAAAAKQAEADAAKLEGERKERGARYKRD